jgi:hypothetical protein
MESHCSCNWTVRHSIFRAFVCVCVVLEMALFLQAEASLTSIQENPG